MRKTGGVCMGWDVFFHPAFDREFSEYPEDLQDEMVAHFNLIAQFGPHLKRPYAGTLKGSVVNNLKELRFRHKGAVWRVAYAFDPSRCAVVLCAADKRGKNDRKFYERFIMLAERRFLEWLKQDRGGQ